MYEEHGDPEPKSVELRFGNYKIWPKLIPSPRVNLKLLSALLNFENFSSKSDCGHARR